MRELATSTHLRILENYSKIFNNFLMAVILLESVLNSHLTFDEIVSDELAESLKEKCTNCKNIKGFTKGINRTEVKTCQ